VIKVLVTGMGAITPLGTDRHSTFANALEGRSGIAPAAEALAKWLPQVLTAAVDKNPEALLDAKYAGIDRATQFALVAAHEAMADAGIAPKPEDGGRFGVFCGIGFGGAQTVDALYTRFFNTLHDTAIPKKNPTVMHPLSVPRMMANAPAALISMHYGLRGSSNTYSVACASSAIAIGEAYRAIRHGYLDAAVVVGTEAMLTPGALMAWNALRVMAKAHPSDPSRSCRPFSVDRNGFVLGEGAAAIVLESEARALQRGANCVAELAGYGCTSDANHLTAGTEVEQAKAMQQALKEANLEPDQVQYLNAHGTATEAGDLVEARSIRLAFGKAADKLAISATKSMHGHLIGACGILEFIISLMAMHSGSIPPTANLENPDPRCDLDFVPLAARHDQPITAIMSNSFAFGGSNATLLARKYG
jgi:3-oxoacyl-[acyl-carrier-protein] synthase II